MSLSGVGLFLRSVLWAVLLPGFFGVYLPWRYVGLRDVVLDVTDPVQLAGLAIAALGFVLLAACIWQFATEGRGTLSPVDAPKELVVRGLYRYVRNPMYLSVTLVVLGEAWLARSRALAIYWIVWFIWVNLFVLFYEEPTLRRQFGASYERYTARVGRWIPRTGA